MKWISINSKRKPKDFESCLCFRPDAVFDRRRVQMYKQGKFNGVYKVTYWQSLPEPPKDQS